MVATEVRANKQMTNLQIGLGPFATGNDFRFNCPVGNMCDQRVSSAYLVNRGDRLAPSRPIGKRDDAVTPVQSIQGTDRIEGAC